MALPVVWTNRGSTESFSGCACRSDRAREANPLSSSGTSPLTVRSTHLADGKVGRRHEAARELANRSNSLSNQIRLGIGGLGRSAQPCDRKTADGPNELGGHGRKPLPERQALFESASRRPLFELCCDVARVSREG